MYIFLGIVLVILIVFAVRANRKVQKSCCDEAEFAPIPVEVPVCVVAKKVAAKKAVKKAVKKVK